MQAHTKVQVIGNNRTKQSLIGRRGVVLGAGDLGGWHTLELDTGEHVRIQRNALMVLEQPAGNVVDQKLTEPSVGISERVKQQQAQRSMKRHALPAPQEDVAAKGPPVNSAKVTRINFNKLDSAALRKYRRHYKLAEVGPNPTRQELVTAVSRHFSKQVVDENQVISSLLNNAAMRRRGLQP